MSAEPRPAALVLSPEAPYPIAGGGALRAASLIHYLAQRYDIDLIVFRQPAADDPAKWLPQGLVRRVVSIELPYHGRGVAARAARNVSRLLREAPPLVDRFAGFDAAIADAVAGRSYEFGLIEHSWCASYWQSIAPVCRRTVIDLHNVESILHRRCAETEPSAAGFAHAVFERASREFEREWLPRFDFVLATSAEDAQSVRTIAPAARVSVYPNAIPATPLPSLTGDEAIVFSGNMEYHPNRSAVRFFAHEVWPALRERFPRLVWRLVGKNPGAVRNLGSGDSRIEIVGPVEDAVGELARSRVAVVPLLAGSGTRLKILEAWAAGLPVVSTTVGAEGLGAVDGTHLLIADGARDLAETTSRLLTCPEQRAALGAAGRLLLEQEFTWETAWRHLAF